MNYQNSRLTLTGITMLSEFLGSETNLSPKERGQLLYEVLNGTHDAALKAAMFFHLHKRIPENNDYMQDSFVLVSLSTFKRKLLASVEEITDRLYRQERQEVINKVVQMHAPAVEGTVSELAAKYNKSKSEIRRLKAEGLLHTLSCS